MMILEFVYLIRFLDSVSLVLMVLESVLYYVFFWVKVVKKFMIYNDRYKIMKII